MKSDNSQLVYLFFRLAMGISMLTHGLVRLPKWKAFASGMTDSFSQSMLPEPLVLATGYAVPLVEFLLGITLILGLFTRYSAIAGSVLMLVLLFGSGMVENWNAMPSQLIHLAYFAALLIYLPKNSLAIDCLLTGKSSE